MFNKWPKPNFLISEKIHSKIAENCVRVHELDSQVIELRNGRRNVKGQRDSKIEGPFISCFASH